MEARTWYLEGPLKQAVSLSVYCVVSVVVKNQTNLGPTELECVCFAIYLHVLVEWVYLGIMGHQKMGACLYTVCNG